MPRRTRSKPAPDAPDLSPDVLEPAPTDLADDARWVGLQAAAELQAAATARNVELRESVLTGVDLAGRDLTGLLCRDVRFEFCDLSGAVLDTATLTRVEFAACRMSGIVLTNCQLQDVLVHDCRADLANCRMSTASYLLVQSSSLREADFYDTRLSSTALLNCDLREASFRDCRLEDVELHGSQLDDLRDPRGLRGAAIDPDQMLPLAVALLAATGVTVTDRPRFGASTAADEITADEHS